MKNGMKKSIVILCAAAMLAAAMSSCNGNNNNNSSSANNSGNSSSTSSTSSKQDNSSEESKEPEKPTPIHIFNRLNPEVSVDNNPLLKAIEEKLNLEIEYEAPPINNYTDKLNITMASGDLPDIIYNWGGADSSYESWAEDGLLAELDDLIPNYPNIVSNVTPEMMEAMRSTTTGKIHSIAKPNMTNYWGMVINSTWLENLDLDAPATLEDYKNVCHAFTYNDPDGNGKNDTYGVSTAVTGTSVSLPYIESAFGLGGGKDSNGEYHVRELKSDFIPFLTYLRELYADGSLDPEYFTNAYMADSEKFRAGQVGSFSSFQTGVHQQLKFVDEETALNNYTYLAPLQNINTGKATVYASPSIWGCWMISADAPVEKCLELIDFGNSEEGFVLMNLGIQGVDYDSYDYDARGVTRSTEQAQTLATYSSSYFTFAFAKDGYPAIYENVDNEARLAKFNKDFDAAKAVIDLVAMPSVKTPLGSTFGADNPDLVSKRSQLETQYVVGEIDEATYRAFMDNEYAPAAAAMDQEYADFMKAHE